MILLKKSFSSLPATLSLLAALAAVSCTKVREVGNEPSPAGTVQFAASLSGYAAGDNDLTKTTATSCREFTGGPMKLYLHSISSDRPSETVAFSSLKKEETDTKGAVTTSVYSTMAVSGYMWTGAWDGSVASNYCYKKTMNWAGGQWVYDGRLVWPGADMKLRFYSVSPASVPDLTWSGESATGAPTVTYTSPTTIASQVDFLDAVTPDIAGDGAAVSSTVTFTFNHALTAVRFNAAAGFGAAVTVKSITLSGVYGTGTHVIGSTGTSAWTGYGGVSTYVLNPGVALTAGGAAKPLSSGADELLLIPQTCPAGALATVVLTWEGDDYTLECNLAGEVWEAGKEVVYTVSLSESGKNSILARSDTVSAPGFFKDNVLTASGQEQIHEELMNSGHSFYQEIMLLDLVQLAQCDAVLVLGDWHNSPGSKPELMLAMALQMPIFQEAPNGRLFPVKFDVRRIIEYQEPDKALTVGEVMEKLKDFSPDTPMVMSADFMLGEPFVQSFDRQIHGPIYEVRANDDLRVNCGMTAVLDAYMSCIISFD